MLHLPEETLEQIFSHLQLCAALDDFVENRAKLMTLLSICRVSRTCHRAAQHALLGTLNLNFFDEASIARLLRRMIERPSSRNMVHHISAVHAGTQDPDERHTAVRAPIVPAMLACVDELKAPTIWKEHLRDKLEQGLGVATLSLLLCLCSSRLTSIDIDVPYDFEDTILMTTFQEAAAGRLRVSQSHESLFASLREAKVRYADTMGTVELTGLSSLFQQPALGSFHGFMMACTVDSSTSSFQTTQLTHINLEYSNIDDVGLQHILRLCPSLETLAVELGDALVEVHEVDYGSFGDALRAYGMSLRELRFDAPYAFSQQPEGHLGDLRSLTKLQLLLVRSDALFGVDKEEAFEHRSHLFENLPPSLHTLGINEADQHTTMAEAEVDPSLSLLAQAVPQSLRRICLLRSACLSSVLGKHGWGLAGKKAFQSLDRWQTWNVLDRGDDESGP